MVSGDYRLWDGGLEKFEDAAHKRRVKVVLELIDEKHLRR